MVQKHIELLGHKVKDKVTGFKGVITTMSFDLYGCIQAAVTPESGERGDQKEGRWFDITRLKVTSKKRVMEVPNFRRGYISTGSKGAAEKPPM